MNAEPKTIQPLYPLLLEFSLVFPKLCGKSKTKPRNRSLLMFPYTT